MVVASRSRLSRFLCRRAAVLVLLGTSMVGISLLWSYVAIAGAFDVLTRPNIAKQDKAVALADAVSADMRTRLVRTLLFDAGLAVAGLGVFGFFLRRRAAPG